MTTLTERPHAGEFLISEANGHLSRDMVTLLAGTVVVAGAVLGMTSAGAVTGAALAGNAGGATIGTLSSGPGVKPGVYRATIIEPASGLGNFVVEDPDGVQIGHGIVGTPFSNEVVFTISDGTPDASAGDVFLITVAEGAGKFVPLNPVATNGAALAAGISWDDVDATDADVDGAAIRRHAEVYAEKLVWPAGISDAAKNAAIAALGKSGIVVRT